MKNKNLKLKREFEIKSVKEAEDGFAYFSGYVAAFGNIDHDSDIIQKGAFSESIAQTQQYPLLWNHKTDMPIGSITEVKEDEYGVHITGRINLAVEKGNEVYALLKAGDVKKMSVGFMTLDREWKEMEGKSVRYIKKARLLEGSLVVFPANDNASVMNVKSIEETQTLADIEDILTEKEFSRNEAKALISVIKKIANQRDVEEQSDQRDVESGKANLELKDMLANMLLKQELEKLSKNINN